MAGVGIAVPHPLGRAGDVFGDHRLDPVLPLELDHAVVVAPIVLARRVFDRGPQEPVAEDIDAEAGRDLVVTLPVLLGRIGFAEIDRAEREDWSGNAACGPGLAGGASAACPRALAGRILAAAKPAPRAAMLFTNARRSSAERSVPGRGLAGTGSSGVPIRKRWEDAACPRGLQLRRPKSRRARVGSALRPARGRYCATCAPALRLAGQPHPR